MPLKERKEITDLRDAIRATHGCEAEFLDYITRIQEPLIGEIAREVFVHSFRLIGHPKAKRCYVWNHREGDEIKTVSVLEIPPVNSPKSAVHFSIAGMVR